MTTSKASQAISRPQVTRLLKPKSIAVIGVSERPGSAGRNCVSTLDAMGYKGEIHLVSRGLTELDGRKAVASVSDLPDGIDLAVLTLPGAGIVEAVEVLAPKKLGGIMCFASGFAEMSASGAAAQDRLTEIAHRHDIAFAGPNCLGYTNLVDGHQVTFSLVRTPATLATDLKVDIICQSGGMAGVLRIAAAAEGIGICYSITTGNEAVLGIEDYMPFAIENEQSRAVVMLAEIIRRPGEFLKHAAAARAKKKPIVLLHLSRSQQSREAAKTHTGALAGDYDIMASFVRSRDVVLVESLDELMDVMVTLTHYPAPPKGALGVVTDSGACKGFSLDYADFVGLPVADLTKETRARLRAAVPEFVEATNPVDVTAQAMFDPGLYTRSIDALMRDDRVGSVVAAIISGNPEVGLLRSGFIADGKVENGKPLLCAFMGGDQAIDPQVKPKLAQKGIPFFRSPERAIRALARASQYGDALRKGARRKASIKVPAAKMPAGGGALTEIEGKAALKAAGIPVPKGALAKTLSEAKAIASKIKYPVVLKAQAAALTHKSDAGGVAINIKNATELGDAWKAMQRDVKKARPDLTLDGILVEKMGQKGVEIVIGARRDAAWGPTLMIGLGGVFTEALKDVRFLPADSHPSVIAQEIRQLRGAKLLGAFRGEKPRDVAALADAAARVGALMLATPGLTDIDVNPVIVFADGEGVVAVDALLVGHES
ncbi:MAG TPA: acetate--CoA ligase family protein [Stellaceae bacterium]|nr:acetate--CoA ligase family protein [Stellaceae bacterium]